MPRPRDNIRVEAVGIGELAAPFTSIAITNDIMSPSEAAFELGNAGTFSEIQKHIAHGTKYKVWVNDLLRLTGRVEAQDIPIDASAGSVVRFTVRTKLADAMYANVIKPIKVRDTTIKKFLLDLYAPLGYTESDFIFDQGTARDLITGRSTKQYKSWRAKHGKTPTVKKEDGTTKKIKQFPPTDPDLDKITLDEAKIQPGETIYDAADRHLRRHGLIHWDSPDGKIVVGAPNDEQPPVFHLQCNRGTGRENNNVIGLTRVRDWSELPTDLSVFGMMRGKGTSRKRVGFHAADPDAKAAGFYRPVNIMAEGLKTGDAAERAARREMSARAKQKDAWQVELDQWSYWDGQKNTPWGIDCVVNIESDIADGLLGWYYVHRTLLRRDPTGGDVTNLTVLKAGIWSI